jgi:hypothetical protein
MKAIILTPGRIRELVTCIKGLNSLGLAQTERNKSDAHLPNGIDINLFARCEE